jgi:hypothetical protein
MDIPETMTDDVVGDMERRTCEGDCNDAVTHRLRNSGGEHLFVCESCAEKFNGEEVTVEMLSEPEQYVVTTPSE